MLTKKVELGKDLEKNWVLWGIRDWVMIIVVVVNLIKFQMNIDARQRWKTDLLDRDDCQRWWAEMMGKDDRQRR